MTQRHTIAAFGLGVLLTGLLKTWLHLTSGAVLTVGGCQGSAFQIEVGVAAGHCWGCYAIALGAGISLAPFILRFVRLEQRSNPLQAAASS